MNGWIKLHRKILDWGWYSDINTRVVFIHLLLLANFDDRYYLGKKIKKGIPKGIPYLYGAGDSG